MADGFDPFLRVRRRCCCCGVLKFGVRNIAFLPYKGAEDGKGWGCIVCKAPPVGAVALVCDHCSALDDPPPIRYILAGGLAELEVKAFDPATAEPFGHDLSKHPEFDFPSLEGYKKRATEFSH